MNDRFSFNVAICDDEQRWCNAIFESCRRFVEKNNVGMNIFSYDNGEKLISDKDKEIDLLFLDVEMESMNGLEVMKKVEVLPNIHTIIFVSSHSEAVWDSFGYKTKGFVPKPFSDEDLWNKIIDVYSKKLSDGVLKFSDASGIVLFNKSDIILLRADSNYVKINTKNSERIVTCTLKECEKKLGGLPFVRIHKSYIVNLDYVSNLFGGEVVLKNNDSYKIGRSFREQVKKTYHEYLVKELHL
ncbi:MAG: response regulator transcription factor [Eubacterium sp.]|nr:response regulator transcription factor [Eubacterium sp.]